MKSFIKLIFILGISILIFSLIISFALSMIHFKGGKNITGKYYVGLDDPTYEFCQDYVELKGHVADFSKTHSEEETLEFLRSFETPNKTVTRISKVVDVKWVREASSFNLDEYYSKVDECLIDQAAMIVAQKL